MREPMHPLYTLVPNRSIDAYVKYGTLDEVLCALIVDPDEAYDAARECGVKNTPHSLRDFEISTGSSGVSAALQTVAEWTMNQPEARIAMRQIGPWDRYVACWCASQCVRIAVMYSTSQDQRLIKVIETAELEVVSRVTRGVILEAARNVSADVYISTGSYAARAVSSLIDILLYSEKGAFGAIAAEAVRDAASAMSDDLLLLGKDWQQMRDLELVRFRSVIAEACMTFPR